MTQLPIPEAVHYLRSLILPASKRACLAYWRERYGDIYVARIKKMMNQ